MGTMKTADIREQFLQFFESKGHTRVASSPLIPPLNDHSLLFTNAGMNQFKDVFLGFDTRPYTRATSVQKCVRAGGKHNDLENVGYTTRHLTFFEMLGNFSFGDYFKEKAIEYAWEFLTSTEWLSLPPEKLWVTVYEEDIEAYKLWRQCIGLPEEKIIKIGDNKGARYASDNFWQMGDTGPCGPCTEIFYDHGDTIWGGPPGSAQEDGDRFVEVWNCVFMQYNRDAEGELHLLDKPCVDTGMGLERIAAVLQKVKNNFEIDLFRCLIEAIMAVVGFKHKEEVSSVRVIADHIRTCSFLIAEGIYPGNEGRSYVLRRIIRRAVRHGFRLGQTQPFFYQLVPTLVELMGGAYPELVEKCSLIQKTLREEEEKFSHTLSLGLNYLQGFLATNTTVISGEIAFKLYDTYGFPLDLTVEIAREKNVKVDKLEFERHMELQRERARKVSAFQGQQGKWGYFGADTKFSREEGDQIEVEILALYNAKKECVDRLASGEVGVVVLDKTPFYAEGGGQIGDRGYLYRDSCPIFQVDDTQKIKAGVFAHMGTVLSEDIVVHQKAIAKLDAPLRRRIERNHTATHLLHSALRKVLGSHVQQRGSLVTGERLRFDFTHPQSLTHEELLQVEEWVNNVILQDYKVTTQLLPYDQALKTGAIALFGEKYQSEVRVIQIGEFSVELCGGTHVRRSGEIGFFKILSEVGIASGVRRIEAITGESFFTWLQKQEELLKRLQQQLKVPSRESLVEKIEQLTQHQQRIERELIDLRKEQLQVYSKAWLARAQVLKNFKLVIEKVEIGKENLREALRACTSQSAAVAVLYIEESALITLGVGVSRELSNRVEAREILQWILQPLGGKGGGKAELAQGTLRSKEGFQEALNSLSATLWARFD